MTDTDQAAWIASSFFVCAVATPLIVSSLMRWLERRRAKRRMAALNASVRALNG